MSTSPPQTQRRAWTPPDEFFRDTVEPAVDYSSMAREAAARYRVDPNIFERQIAHESINYNPEVVAGRRKSPAGAIGIAQFMPETAARYGLRGADLHDPEKSLDAAARHMRDLLDDTDDDYEAALAGYNAGIGRVRDGSWRNISETRNYTRTILGNAGSKSRKWTSPDTFFANLGTPSQVTAPGSEFDLRPERFTLNQPRPRLSARGEQGEEFNFEAIRPKRETVAAAPRDESQFQTWYRDQASRLGLNPNPDDPQHRYDYRAAYRAGAEPDASGHWPSQFKALDHPNRYVVENGQRIDTITNTRAKRPLLTAQPSEFDWKALRDRPRDDHSDAWKQSQADMGKRAADAGLPQTTDSRQRLIDAIDRVAQAGFKTPHFIGSSDEPTGDRGVTRDLENLVSSLKSQEAATPIGPARDAISKQRAYWEQEAAEGMTAQEWKGQTGEPDPLYPGEAPAKSPSQPPIAETVDVAGGEAMGEDDVYRQWYSARQSGNLGAASMVAKSYLDQFPRGKYADAVRRDSSGRRPVSDAVGRKAGAGAYFPVSAIEGMRKQGVADAQILRAIQDDVARQAGLSDSDVAALTERYGEHPFANIVEPGSNTRSSLQSIIRQGRSNAGLAEFKIDPEAIATVLRDRDVFQPAAVAREETAQSYQPHLYEGTIPGLDTAREGVWALTRSKPVKSAALGLAALMPYYAEDIGRVFAADSPVDEVIRQTGAFATNTEQAMLSGLTAPLKGIAALREGLLRGRGRVSDELRQLGSIGENLDISTSGVRLRDPNDPSYRKAYAQATQNTIGGRFGQAVGSSASMMLSGAGLSNALGISGAAAAAATGALQQAAQTYDEALSRGASREDAAAYSIFGALIGLTEGWGLGGTIDRVALRALSRNLVKAGAREGLGEFGQEFSQGFLSNVLAHFTYDPQQGVFTPEALKKNVEDALIGFVTGAGMGGAMHAGAQLQERISDSHLVDSTERALSNGRTINPDRFAAYLDAVERQVIREQGIGEPEQQRAPLRERAAAARDTMLDRPMPSVVPQEGGPEADNTAAPGTPIVHTPLNKHVHPATVKAEVQGEIGRVVAEEIAAAGPPPNSPQIAVTSDLGQAARPGMTPELPQSAQNRPESVSGGLEVTPTPSDAWQPIPEAPETLVAQLQALRERRGNRQAVLVTAGSSMPATKGALESEGIATTRTAVGTFLHDPRVVSRQTVKQMAADGSFHQLLGIVQQGDATTTEAVVARDEAGTELQAALTSPENVPSQVSELQTQFPQADIGVEGPEDVIADRLDSVGSDSALEMLNRMEREGIVAPRQGSKQRGVLPRTEGVIAGEVEATPVDVAAHEAATSPRNDLPRPTEAQIQAGVYKKGHVRIAGLDISIENPEGTKRRPEWPTLKSHYGNIRKTEGGDGEQVDVFVKPGTTPDYAGPVFVVDQSKASGEFDEHKTMLGWPDEAAAKAAYAENYTPGWKVGPIRGFRSVDEFRDWLRSADTTKPSVVPGWRAPERENLVSPTGESSTKLVKPKPKGPRSILNTGPPPGGWTEADKVPAKYRKQPDAQAPDVPRQWTPPDEFFAQTTPRAVSFAAPQIEEIEDGGDISFDFGANVADALVPSAKGATIPPEVGNEPASKETSTRRVGESLPTPSAEVLPGPPRATKTEPTAKRGSVQGAGEREGSVHSAQRPGDGAERSERAGDEGVRVSDPARGRGPAAGVGEPGRRDESAGGSDVDARKGPAEGSQAQPASHSPGNYRIKDPGELTAGGAKTKFRQNIQAIQTLRQIEAEGRAATAEEQATLSRFSGWGQFPGVFNPYTREGAEWSKENSQLRDLLSDEEYEAARKSTLNAHYTDPEIVQAMWEAAAKLGFKEGRLLEPSLGIGTFFGLMPSKLRAKALLTGVELDDTTGKMAKLLYPKANVQVKGFEKLQVPDGFYDLAIGNVPFGDYRVHDPEYNRLRANIHDYFFLKSLDKVRPGGLVMFITSTGTMDKADPRIRRLIAEKADLVAAIRFPSMTFQKSAGTAVVTDLIVLRRRSPDGRGQAWIDTKEVPDPDRGSPIPVNEYFAAHPEQILGRLDRRGTMYRGESVNVTRTDDFEVLFKAAINRLPSNVMSPPLDNPAFEPRRLEAPDELKQYNYVVKDGKLFQKEGDHMVEQEADKTTIARISGMIRVRDALRYVFNTQLLDMDASEQARARATLNKTYDAFVNKHGALTDTANKRAIADDPDAPVLLALETYDPQTKRAAKSDVFTRNTVRSYVRPTKAGTPGEALSISLHDTGVVSLDRIGELLGVAPEEAGKRLVAQGLAFNDPSDGYIAKDLYLSGNVRQKLIQAREASKADPQFEPNVEALEKVQPEDVPHTDIAVRLGAPWVAPDDIADFAAHLLSGSRGDFKVSTIRSQGSWIAEYSNRGGRLSTTQLAQAVWGTPRSGFMQILQAALSDKPIVIYDKTAEASVVNHEASAAANAKVKEVRDAFDDWIWEDDSRRERLHRYYNDNFNNIRTIDYSADHYRDEAGDYQFPGMNPGIKLRPHQANAVWQIVSTGRALLAHEVGTGKTFTMVTGAMELRRLGLAKKPAIAVPKAIIEGFVKDAQRLYPNAKIITTEGRFDAARRRETVSRIATGDYDIVILTHDNIDMLPMQPDTVREFVKREIEELEQAKAIAHEEDGSKNNRVVKQLEKAKAKLEARLKDAIEGSNKDNAVFFEETGIDHLFVDEAHKYKSLPVYTSRTRIKGIPTSRSDRATNMLMRTRWLQENQGGRGVVFATGTPIANTMVELYNIQRYLQYPELEQRGIASFDGWANTFGETSTKMEYSVSGTYQPVTRFAKYSNLPELLQISRQVMDVRRAADMPESIQRPNKIEEVISVPMSDEQRGYLRSIQARAKWVKENPRLAMQKGYDNMLKISGDARKSAMDMRLVSAVVEGDVANKARAVSRKVLEIHRDQPTVTQMIFSDIGINPTDWGFSIYKEIVRKLVAGGIPRNRIIDFSTLTDTQKRTAIQKLRTGDALVGIGSTDKMGTGVNAQDYLYSLHHIDAPWLPASVEQRDGRGWRQGNNNTDVMIFRYVTTGSFDTFMWQVLDAKSRFIKQAMEGRTDQRAFKEEDTEELTPAKVMAIASGNPHLLAKVQLDEDVADLERSRKRHEQAQVGFKNTVQRIRTQEIPESEEILRRHQSDFARVEATADQKFAMTVMGRKYAERKQAAEALTAAAMAAEKGGGAQKIGEIRGFDIYQSGSHSYLHREREYGFQVNEEEAAGTVRSLESVLRNIEGRVVQSERALQRAKGDLLTAQEQIGKPFKNAEQLASKRSELSEVEAKLRAKPPEEVEARAAESGESEQLSARERLRHGLAATKEEARVHAETGAVRVGLLLGGQGGGNQPPGKEYGGFSDPETERRWQAAKGLRPEPVRERIKRTLTRLKNLATREMEHLPRTGEFAELRFALNRLAQGKGIQSDEAVRILQGLTAKLDKSGHDLYTRRVILDDLLEETDRQEAAGDEVRLPFGFTPDSLVNESRRLYPVLNQRPEVVEAVAGRRALIKEVTGDYLAAAKAAIGFEPKLGREAYYHHQVLDLATARGGPLGTGQKVQAPTGRGFLKKRHGSDLDINTNYLQAEHTVLAQMLYDTQVFKLLRLVDENHNIGERLKTEAKQANARAIEEIIDREDAQGLNQPKGGDKRKSLSEFVRGRGGFKPDEDLQGELDRISYRRGMVTPSGVSPDYMREAAVEAGYFQPDEDEASNVGNFIYAVEEDLSGRNKRYSLFDEEPAFAGPIFLTVGEQMKLFKVKIGRSFAELRQLASDGELWTGEKNEWETAVRRLQATRNYDEDLNDRGSLFRYLAALAGAEEATGNMQARIILKAISQRREFVKRTLGPKFKRWDDLVPDSHVLWQPREGNVFYQQYTLPEKLVNQALENFYESIGFEGSDLRRALVMGGRRKEFAVPSEVALTLDSFMKPPSDSPLDSAVRKTVRGWKVWQLLSPHRVIKYNARNLSGDSDAVFVGNPSAFARAPRAVNDLWEYLVRTSAPSPELQEWLIRGGLQNLFHVADNAEKIGGLKMFRNLEVDESGTLQRYASQMNVFARYWRTVRMGTDFREALLRYAAFLDYRAQMTSNAGGRPSNYGASIPDEVKAMSSVPDKAYKLANDLLGAYDEVSEVGQWLREHLFPFWSWQEVNAKRYYRFARNAIYEGTGASEVGQKLLGKSLRASPIVAYRVGKFALKATMLWALLEAFNNLVFPDEEKDLDAKTRARMHVVLGRRDDGTVIYFDRLGMLGDFLSWFGVDEGPHYVSQFLNNRQTLQEIAVSMAKAPVNKIWQGTGLPKVAAELAIGKQTYPDVFRARNIRDRWQYLFNSFALGNEYNAATGKPGRGLGRTVRNLFVYEVQPEESAYNEILSLKSDFNRKRGKAADVAAGNDKSNAAYYMKLALRYGDVEAAKRYLMEYKELAGTPQGLQQSIKAMAPLAGLNEREKAEFLATLTADEKERLTKAQMFFDAVLDKSGDIGPADLLPRPIPKSLREPVDRELHRLGISFPFSQNEVTISGKKVELPKGRWEEFQQGLAEGVYREVGNLLAEPRYKDLRDEDKQRVIEDFKRAWVDQERQRLHAEMVLESGATGAERVDARSQVRRSGDRRRELEGSKTIFIKDRQIEWRKHPKRELPVE